LLRHALGVIAGIVVSVAGCQQPAPARVDAPADSAAGEVAFELIGPGGAALVVPVHVNGTGPYEFVLDTGATVTCLNQELATGLDLPKVRGVIGMGAGVGSQGRLELVSIDSLRVGHALVHDMQACVVDLEHLAGVGLELDGLLGLNVLREFRVSIDFDRSIVILQRP
jgi:predicted aspartyl protease